MPVGTFTAVLDKRFLVRRLLPVAAVMKANQPAGFARIMKTRRFLGGREVWMTEKTATMNRNEVSVASQNLTTGLSD